ncbi:hypothetical protein [Glutamicibacter sp.]|uniref:hypothetical protein n=1 Tax=Glutamicibacter sp. TaxID=1931995 RepID=UPI003D6B9D4A
MASFITGSGIFYIPSMVTAWMLAGINRELVASKKREGRSKLIRIVGGISLLLPVVFLGSGLFAGMGQGIAVYLYLALGLACALGFLMNWRIAVWAKCISGAVLLTVSFVQQGLLLAAFWLGGAAYSFFGLYGLMRFKQRGAASRRR